MPPGACLAAEAGPGDTVGNVGSDDVEVNQFRLGDPVLDALQATISPERFGTYLSAAEGDRVTAMRLYTWNTTLSAAFYGPLQGLEVALRNAMHRELSRAYGLEWYDNPRIGLDAGAVDRIRRAKDELGRGRYPVDPPHLVAALTFGFWVSLFGRGGRGKELSAPKRDYEMSLWRPALRKSFPNERLRRATVQKQLDYLRTFRNRIAHHEPIFQRHLAADHASILTVTGWICLATRDWIAHHSRVPSLLSMRKEDAAALF